MSKAKKIFLNILLCLLISLGIAYVVLYSLYRVETLQYTYLVIDYICNKPLPVIGISALMVGAIIFKIVGFILKNKGQNYKVVMMELKAEKEKVAEYQKEIEELKKLIYEQADKTTQFVQELCENLPNKKIKLLGEKYGKERTNSQAETKEI